MADNSQNGDGDHPKENKPELTDRLVGATASGDGTEGPPKPEDRERIANQAGAIFSQFMWERFSNDLETRHLPENTPSLPELNESKPRPFSNEERIGIQLAAIGDEIADKYSAKISKMIDCLKVDDDNAYETFSRVASRWDDQEFFLSGAHLYVLWAIIKWISHEWRPPLQG